MKIHWLGIPIDSTQRIMITPSFRLRYGAARNMADINIDIGNKISKDVSAVIFGKTTWSLSNEKNINNNLELAKNLKKLKIKVIVDYTDNYLANENKKINHLSSDYQERNQNLITKTQEYYKRIIDISDAIITSSEGLKDEVKNIYFTKKIICIPDAIDDYGEIRSNIKNQFLWFGMPISFPFLLDALQKIDLILNKEIIVNCLTDKDIIVEAVKSKKILVPALKNIKIIISQWSINNVVKYAENSICILIPSDLNDSRKKYASSNRIITAFSLNRPVIATKIPSYIEYQDYLIDIDTNQLEAYLNNYEWPEEKLKNALNISKEFLPNKVAHLWSCNLKKIIQENK